MTVKIYHNPRCSKCRETMDLLKDRGIEPTVIEYLATPPTVDELRGILALLGIAPRDLLRNKEGKEAGLDDPALSDEQIIAGMAANPATIERPIVIADGRAVIGRPPRKVLEIL
ncbi:MAG: arsenate reductase (glutaredoxin) [Alphaproteobacteria bacterium]